MSGEYNTKDPEVKKDAKWNQPAVSSDREVRRNFH
jgi:hypothetical protein